MSFDGRLFGVGMNGRDFGGAIKSEKFEEIAHVRVRVRVRVECGM